jgi:hypothetical protein
MKRYTTRGRRAASAAALLAVAGLAVAGCKSAASGAADPGSGSGNSGGQASSSPGSGPGSGSGTSGGSGGSSGSGTTLFPVGVGNTWVYDTDITAVGHGTITNKMTRVVPVAGGRKVTMEVGNSAAGSALKSTRVTYIFHNDGSITVPFTQFGSGSAKITSGKVAWPDSAELADGQPHHSTLVLALDIEGRQIHATAHVTVQGHGTQTVTVPAGTYNAHVIDETIREKFSGVAVAIKLVTWVADNVGPVKEELRSFNGSSGPSTVEVLKSFTKG